MSSAKHIAVFVVAGTVASVAGVQAVSAANLLVNNEAQALQTPSSSPAGGISYVTTGSSSKIKAYTDGFLFCANASNTTTSPANLEPAHEDQSFSPAHAWKFLTVTDVASAGYNSGTFNVNRSGSTIHQTSLTCHGVGAEGDIITSASDGIFDTGSESVTETNYSHLVNWAPTSAFNWVAGDWSQVPANPCIASVNQPAHIVEDTACAAVTGVGPAQAGAVRAATLWTAADSINFTYVFRVDVRFGAQLPNAIEQLKVPTLSATTPDTSFGATFKFIDAYDSAYLSGAGTFCYLASLPTTLNSAVCAGAAITYQLNGPLTEDAISVNPPPVGSGSTSFYVAVNRLIGQGSHPNLATPVVGVSLLLDPALAAEGGDKFIGDDVAFGFIPSQTGSPGFPWMHGQ